MTSQPVDYTKRVQGTLFNSSGRPVCDVIVYGYELADLYLDASPLRAAAKRLGGNLVSSPFSVNRVPPAQPR